jgi:hypothetical protein
MTDNIDNIKELLEFRTEDDFYHLQILKRKKEHPDLGSNSYLVKTYYINSMETLEKNIGEIKLLCDYHGARAYINLNRRSFEKVAKHVHLKLAHQVVINQEYYSVKKVYESVCGGVQSDKGTVSFGGILSETKETRKWVVDIDELEMACLHEVGMFINSIEPIVEDKIHAVTDTPNGYHIISKPFRLDKFKERYPNIDVHKNNPTILYVP